jgi:hypothetical protein
MTAAVLDRGAPPVAEAPVVRPHGGPGRTRITAKALEHVADDRGDLALVVTSPLRAIPLSRVSADPESVRRSGGSVVERVSAATGAIAARVEQLSGSHVSRVSIRVSGLEIDQEGRVS